MGKNISIKCLAFSVQNLQLIYSLKIFLKLEDLDPAVGELAQQLFIKKGENILIPMGGLNRVDVSFFMNHSRTPNVYPDSKTDVCFAMRDIKKGEELTFDYEAYCGEDTDVFMKEKSD